MVAFRCQRLKSVRALVHGTEFLSGCSDTWRTIILRRGRRRRNNRAEIGADPLFTVSSTLGIERECAFFLFDLHVCV